MLLKERLLNTGLFEDNEYLERYCKLVNINKNTKKQQFKTQRHHILPITAYEILNLDGVNKADNLVNLLYKDHILAHYYLALCAKHVHFKYKMFTAINFILGKSKQININTTELKQYVENLDLYQQLYEESKQYFASKIRGTAHDTSEETRLKIGRANKGKTYVNKDGVVRSLKPEDVDLFLENGWVLGNPNCLKRDTGKGRVIIHKDEVEKYCKQTDLQLYLEEGWIIGHSDQHKQAVSKGTQNYFNSLTPEQRQAIYGVNKGRHKIVSLETKKKISMALLGKKQSEERKQMNSKNKKGTIHMTNGVTDVMIRPEKEQYYLELGYYRGRSKNRKKVKGENSL